MKKSLYFILCFAFLNVLYAMDEEVIVTSSLGGATLAEIDSPIFVITGDDINYTGSTNLGNSAVQFRFLTLGWPFHDHFLFFMFFM